MRLFKSRNFAAANVMMLTLGVALFGTTVLLPQYLQVLMGYTRAAGGHGALAGRVRRHLLLPFVGQLVSQVDAALPDRLRLRRAVARRCSTWPATSISGIDFRTAVAAARASSRSGLAFLFVPINTLVYAGVPPEKNNAVSGIVNLSRNMGGDIGIAFVTTLIARRAQFHQDTLVGAPTCTIRRFTARIAGLAAAFERAGVSTVEATSKAMALLTARCSSQATTLALPRRAEGAGHRHRADGPAAVPHPARPPARRARRALIAGRPPRYEPHLKW